MEIVNTKSTVMSPIVQKQNASKTLCARTEHRITSLKPIANLQFNENVEVVNFNRRKPRRRHYSSMGVKAMNLLSKEPRPILRNTSPLHTQSTSVQTPS